MPPCVGECLPETGGGRDQAGDEDGTTATEAFVHGISDPATDESTAKVGCRVGETQKPGITTALGADSELMFEEGLSAVDDGLNVHVSAWIQN